MSLNFMPSVQLGFCYFYLVSVWCLVVAMIIKRHQVAPESKNPALWICMAFAFLALGDTPHLGLKLVGAALGNLQKPFTFLGIRTDFDTFGALATECTFTLFYVCMLYAWKSRFKNQSVLFFILLLVAGGRFLIMLHPDNVYSTIVIREPWFTVRGIPFVMLQSGVAYLILRDALKAHDKTFILMGLLMIFAMLCFATVLALGVTHPALQMLMFPKTVAYLIIGFVAYRSFYGKGIGYTQPSPSLGGKFQKDHAVKLVTLFALVIIVSLLCFGALYMYFAKAGPTMVKQMPPKSPAKAAEKSPRQYNYTVQGARRTANLMGYEDTEINLLLQKYLDFVPQAPGNLLDLGCAWGFAIQQVLAREIQNPFLKPHSRRILAVDLNQEHLDRIAASTPRELVEIIYMHFPYIKSPQDRRAFSHDSIGATYAGLLLHYLNPDELTEGLKLLYDSTAPGGRVFASVNSAFLSKSLGEDFLRRKQNPADPFPGWYPNVFDNSVPEKVRNEMPKSVCGMEIKFLHVFDEETLSRYFEKAGFKVVEHFYFSRSKMIPMKLLGVIAEKQAALSSVK